MPVTAPKIDFRRRYITGHRILDISQVGYWPFDRDDGGYARDRSGYGNHGVIYGAARVSGRVGGALSFDGVDDLVEAAYSPSLDVRERITIMAWVNTIMEVATYLNAIAGRQESFFLTIGEYTAANPNAVAYMRIPAGIWKHIRGITNINDGKWHHVALTYDNEYLRVYCDGTLENQLYVGGPSYPDTSPLRIGSYRSTGGFQGLIDEVRVYNRALSQAEIIRMMNIGGL